jgi:hypothetical protein
MARTPSATPIPIPAAAPALRPLPLELGAEEVVDDDVGGFVPVLEVEVEVEVVVAGLSAGREDEVGAGRSSNPPHTEMELMVI